MWRRIGMSTARADREAAERAVVQAYTIVGLPAPTRFVWVKSPMAGAVAAAQCANIFQSVNQRVWRKPQEFMSKKLWGKAQDSNAIDQWIEIDNFITKSPLMGLRNNVMMPICQQIVDQQSEKNQQARASVFVSGRHSASNLSAEVWNGTMTALRAELSAKENQRLESAPTWERITEQLQACGFGGMDAIFLALLDYAHLAGFQLRDIEGISNVAKSAGFWWSFNDFCILSDRPKTIALNKQGQLHQERGMAVEYLDGWGVYSLNGRKVTRDVAENVVQVHIE
jgi:hypothetical protein